MANTVLVVGEVADGTLVPITAELLGGARRLVGESGGSVGCALFGSGVEGLAQEAIAFGADEVLVVDDPALAEYNSDAYIQAMQKVLASSASRDFARKLGSELMMFGPAAMRKYEADQLATFRGVAQAAGIKAKKMGN